MKITSLLLCCFFFAFSTLQGQENVRIIENVILFKNEPYVVKMTSSGKIIQFVSKSKDNTKSINNFTSTTQLMAKEEVDETVDLGRISVRNTPKYAQSFDNTKVKSIDDQTSNNSIAIAKKTAKGVNTSQAETTITNTSSNTSITREPLESSTTDQSKAYNYVFAFNHRDASLSSQTINQINTIVELLKDSDNRVELHGYYAEDVDISKILSRNRIKNIRELLVLKGISTGRISAVESVNEDWANNRIQLFIK